LVISRIAVDCFRGNFVFRYSIFFHICSSCSRNTDPARAVRSFLFS
jgi:hypothetical protein